MQTKGGTLRQAVKKPHFYFFSTSQEVYKLILS